MSSSSSSQVVFLAIDGTRAHAQVDSQNRLISETQAERDPDLDKCMDQLQDLTEILEKSIIDTQISLNKSTTDMKGMLESQAVSQQTSLDQVDGRAILLGKRLQETLENHVKSQDDSNQGLQAIMQKLSQENQLLQKEKKEMATRIQKMETWKTRASPLINKIEEVQRTVALLRKELEALKSSTAEKDALSSM